MDEYDENDIFLQREDRIYGTNQKGFTKIVDSWLEKANEDVNPNWRKLHAELYCDGDFPQWGAGDEFDEEDFDDWNDRAHENFNRLLELTFDEYYYEDTEINNIGNDDPTVTFANIYNAEAKNKEITSENFRGLDGSYYLRDSEFINCSFEYTVRIFDKLSLEGDINFKDCNIILNELRELFDTTKTTNMSLILDGGTLTVNDDTDIEIDDSNFYVSVS